MSRNLPISWSGPRGRDARALLEQAAVLLRWDRVGLGAVLALAALLDFFRLGGSGYGNAYYAAAVKSMLESWHNFFFVSFDPGGFVTVDKPPVDLWLQTLSAKILGLSGFSLFLPQALAGVAAVAVLYHLVRRTFGVPAGLLAALALAVMPVSVVASRSNIVDGLLVLVVLLAAWAVLRAAETGELRWLLLGAALVGLGFNVKMLEAYLVVPALGLLYLLAAPRPWRVRAAHLAAAGAVLLAVSLSWSLAVDLTPATQRPYVGSSGTNSELNLAFGYNGLERLTGLFGRFGGRGTGARPPATPRPADVPARDVAAAGGFTVGETGAPGPLRIFNDALGGQVSWLLPLALIGLLAGGWHLPVEPLLSIGRTGAWRTRAWWSGRLRAARALRLDRRQQSFVLWGMWLLTQVVFFSVAQFFHSYYLVMLAPAVAALAGIGAVELWRDYRGRGWRARLLPLALVVTALVQARLIAPYPGYSAWLTPLVLLLALVAAGALLWLRLADQRDGAVAPGVHVASIAPAGDGAALSHAPLPAWLAGRLPERASAWLADRVPPRLPERLSAWLAARRAALPRAGVAPAFAAVAAGMLALLLAPAAWSAATATRPDSGLLPVAGPAQGNDRFARGLPAQGQEQADPRLVAYLEAHRGGARYLVATLNSMTAAPLILQTGQPVMALGGFSGGDVILTVDQLSHLVAQGQVRYFLLSSGRGFNLAPDQMGQLPPQIQEIIEARGGFRSGGFLGGGAFGAAGNGALTAWVSAHCAAVPRAQWNSARTGAAGSQGGFGGFGRGGGANGEPGDSPHGGFGGFGGFGGGGAQQLYDCAAR